MPFQGFEAPKDGMARIWERFEFLGSSCGFKVAMRDAEAVEVFHESRARGSDFDRCGPRAGRR